MVDIGSAWRPCRHRVLLVMIPILLAGCGGPTTTTSAGPNATPSIPAVTGGAPKTTVPSSPAGSEPAPTPTSSAAISACPAAGTELSVEAARAIPASCLPTEPVRVVGWWDHLVRADQPLPDGVNAAMRGPVTELGTLGRSPFLPIDQIDLDGSLPFASIDGQWVVATMTLATDDEHCYWKLGLGGIGDPSPPIWTCPVYGRATNVTRATPPASELAACPRPGAVMAVETFSGSPAACFGSRSVELAGWLDTMFVIGGWEAPWSISPEWLWSMQIGAVPVLAPGSDPWDDNSLILHMAPASAVATAERNRYVVLTGHYARATEYEQCRFLGTTAMPVGDAQSDCARAFIAESVRDGAPG
jgi:hypothetical protein